MQGKLVHFTHFHFFQTSSGDMQTISLEPQAHKSHAHKK